MVFEGSPWFPFALSAIGVLIMVAGARLRHHESRIERLVAGLLPRHARRLLPGERPGGRP